MGAATKDRTEADSIVCLLCNRRFRAVSNTHLIRVHDLDPEHPVEDYKERFGLERAESVETRRRQVRSLKRTLEGRGRLWTKQRVLREIRVRAERGLGLNSKTVLDSSAQLVLAGRRLFGAWDSALRSAGLDPRKLRRRLAWTRDRILREIRALARSREPLNHSARHRRGDGLVPAARREFGSWDLALKAAGLDPEKIRLNRRWTPQRILEAIRRLDPVPVGAAAQRADPSLFDAARRRWRTWAAAVAAAGRPVPPRRQSWDVPFVVAEIRRLADRGDSLKPRLICTRRGSLWRAARREFGSWSAAVAAALAARRAAPDGEVATVRGLILRRYGRLLERGWADDGAPRCVCCGSSGPLEPADLVPRTVRIRPACASCPRLLGPRNRTWTCAACAEARRTAPSLYAWFRARHPAEPDASERIPAAAELRYLRTLYDCHRCAGTLDAPGDVEAVVPNPA